MILSDVDNMYINTNSVIEVACDYCGKHNYVTYKNYVKSMKTINKYACKKCVGFKCSEITLLKRQTNCLSKLTKICNDEGYELLSDSDDIKNNKSYIKYKCPIHGIHTMRIANMLSGKGCPDCARDRASKMYRNAVDDVVFRVEHCGGKLLNPDEYINNHIKNLKITCPSCGNEFITSFVHFVQHGGQLCTNCRKATSIGEARIQKYLDEHNISYIQQYWFNDCRDVNPLPFDFYIPELNLIIEFDGRQHFEETSYFSYSLTKTQEHDNIKNNYCKEHKINIVRIHYTEIDNIPNILNKTFT